MTQDAFSENVLTFQQYAGANFRGNVNYKHSSRMLSHSLLELECKVDNMVIIFILL